MTPFSGPSAELAIGSQRGAALIISLVVLLVLTIIAITGASSSSLELLIATNNQSAGEALAAAENSVLAGEQYLRANHAAGGPSFDFSANQGDGLYNAGGVDVSTVDWSGFGSQQEFDAGGDLVAEYVIEYLGVVAAAGGTLASGAGAATSPRYIYRVTGRGESSRGSLRLVQTIFATQ